MAKLQDTEIFGNLAVTGNTTVAGSIQVAGDGDDVLRVGDDCWIKDVDIANAIGIIGKQTPANGIIVFGDGKDTNIYRSAASTLKTDDNLIVGIDLTITGNTISGSSGIVMELETTRLVVKGGGDAGGGSASGRLIIGPSGTSGAHICMDENEIMAKTNATTTAGLHIQTDGGNLDIGINATSTMKLHNGTFALPSGTTINEFSTDNALSGDSDDAVPTEKAVKYYVANSSPAPTNAHLCNANNTGRVMEFLPTVQSSMVYTSGTISYGPIFFTSSGTRFLTSTLNICRWSWVISAPPGATKIVAIEVLMRGTTGAYNRLHWEDMDTARNSNYTPTWNMKNATVAYSDSYIRVVPCWTGTVNLPSGDEGIRLFYETTGTQGNNGTVCGLLVYYDA